MAIAAPARPSNERRGSIELREHPDASFWITYDTPGIQSNWHWDGKPWDEGYYWDDELGLFTDDSSRRNAPSSRIDSATNPRASPSSVAATR